MRLVRATGAPPARTRRRYILTGTALAGALMLALIPQFGGGQAGETMFTDIATPAMAEPAADSPGACWADLDGDGDQDLFVANSSLKRREETSHLWRNEGGAQFVDVAEAAGITSAGSRKFVGCAFVDIDNDGDLDLYLTAKGTKRDPTQGNRLFENRGDGTFTDRTVAAGVGLPGSGGNASDWADYDGDGDYDGFVANRSPDTLNTFFEQVAPFVFKDVGPAKGLADPAGPETAFLGSWFDYDADGDPDLLLALDWWGAELYRNDSGAFTRVTTPVFPPATDETPGAPPNNAMGVGWGDYNNDGCFDVFITGMNFHGQGGFDAAELTDLASRLYQSNCDGTFRDATRDAGFTPTGLIEWTPNFIDFDNDGDLDLSVVAGNASDPLPAGRGRPRGMARQLITLLVTGIRRVVPPGWVAWAYRYEVMIPASGATGPAAAMPKFLYQNQLVETGRPTFVDVTARMGVGDIGATRGSAWADMDNDGDLDWFVPNRGTANRLFRNNGPAGHYLRVQLEGRRLKTALGAWVKIRVGNASQLRHVHVLDGYLSQSQMDPHFGLGSAGTVDEVWVRWPGTTAWDLACRAVPADRTLTVTEGRGCRW